MQLMFFRHGAAERHSPDGSDAARRLTPDGIDTTVRAARGLATFCVPPNVILTSPKVRARQTAELVGKIFRLRPQTLDVLAEGSALDILQATTRQPEDCVMLVGHEPMLSEAITMLCAGRPTATSMGSMLELRKSGCACVHADIEDGKFISTSLLWLVTPAMLRALSP